MKRATAPLFLAALALAASALAQAKEEPSSVKTTKSTVEVLPLNCEKALALSAAPEYLRAEANVLALTHAGFEKAQSGSNGFTCVVNRDDPRVLKPTCFDKEGLETVVPKVIFTGERMLAGEDIEAIDAKIDAKFESGEFVSQRQPGVAYMLSRYNRPVNPMTGRLGFFPPHVMFHAPNLTNADIGHDMNHFDPNRPLPMIGYQGRQGYMLMISDDGTPRSRSDLPKSCPAWIFEE